MRIVRTCAALAAIALLAAWVFLFRPVGLGGPATYVVVTGTSMEPTLVDGDFAVLSRADRYGSGDVVTYRVADGEPGAGTMVIHRIVGGDAEGFVTQGDNRDQVDDWHPAATEVSGKLWFHVPGLGLAIRKVREPALFGALAGGFAVVLVLTGSSRRRDESEASDPDGGQSLISNVEEGTGV